MDPEDIDDVDRSILYALQEDARNMSSGDIAERTGTSDSTVRKRIQRLESNDVVKGYSADIDYQKSGFPLRMLLFCTASIAERGDLISDVLAIDGVISVQELVTGHPRPGRESHRDSAESRRVGDVAGQRLALADGRGPAAGPPWLSLRGRPELVASVDRRRSRGRTDCRCIRR